MLRRLVLASLLSLALLPAAARAADKFIVVQSTTSTEQSGLFGHLLPVFTDRTGIEVRVVAVGTGQAIKNARNGDGDVSPRARRSSAARARSSAQSLETVRNERSVGSVASMRARTARVRSTEEISRRVSAARASSIVSRKSSDIRCSGGRSGVERSARALTP